jgi:heat shock protein HslJ
MQKLLLTLLTTLLLTTATLASSLEKTWLINASANGAHPMINLSGGSISGTDSCNSLIGTYKLKGKNGIAFLAASTMMMCSDMKAANAFHKGLRLTKTYQLHGDQLHLRDDRGKTVLKLVAVTK